MNRCVIGTLQLVKANWKSSFCTLSGRQAKAMSSIDEAKSECDDTDDTKALVDTEPDANGGEDAAHRESKLEPFVAHASKLEEDPKVSENIVKADSLPVSSVNPTKDLRRSKGKQETMQFQQSRFFSILSGSHNDRTTRSQMVKHEKGRYHFCLLIAFFSISLALFSNFDINRIKL